MSWSQQQSQPPPQQSLGHLSGPLPGGQMDIKEDVYTQDMFVALKQSYEERVKSLELQVKEIYNIVENDEITNTMKLNEVSDEFRRLRVQEIVEENLLAEKEMQIDRLIQINVYMKSEFIRSEEEKDRMKKIYHEEIEKFQKIIDEFEDLIQKEAEEKQNLRSENERLSKILNTTGKQERDSSRTREDQFDQSVQGYQNEIFDLKQEIEQLKLKSNEKDTIIVELTSDIETMREEFAKLEDSYNQLVGDYNGLKDLLNQNQESDMTDNGGIIGLQEKLFNTETELKKANKALHAVLAEKSDLINKSEDIAAQAKQIVEKEQQNISGTLNAIQNKYKTKKITYKRRLEELGALNQELGTELDHLRMELNETRINNKNLSLQLENNVKSIRNEWENRCQEMELNSQKALSELATKYQIEITQLQTEYQSVLDRKLSELQNEASNQLSKTKSADIELKAQLGSRIVQIEKDYISKTKHEHILTNELLDQRAKHVREVRDLEERLEKEYNHRIKEIVGRTRNEYESELDQIKSEIIHLTSLKTCIGERKGVEQQFARSENINQKNHELLIKEKQRTQKLAAELTDTERKLKDLKAHFEETTQALNKLRKYCEEESAINKNLEQVRQEMSLKVQTLEKKESSSNQLIAMLRNEISTLNDTTSLQRNRTIEIEAQNLSLSDQIEHLEKYIEKLENTKAIQTQRIQELSDDLNKMDQKSLESAIKARKEVEHQAEKELNSRHAIENKLYEVELRANDLEVQLAEKVEKTEELHAIIIKFEKSNNDLKTKNQDSEEETKNSRIKIKELQKALEKSRRAFEEKLSKVWRLLMFKVEGLRSELTTIRTKCKSELELYQHTNQEVIRQLISHFQGKLSFDKLRLQEEKRRDLQDIREEYEEKIRSLETDYQQDRDHEKGNTQKIVDNYIRENKILTSTIDEVKKDFHDVLAKIEKTNQENQDYKRRVATIEEENTWLRRANTKKDEEFETLQQFVKGELRRIKEESNQITKDVTQQIRSKNKHDLEGLVQVVDELKHTNVQRLKHFESELMNYELTHERELLEVSESFQKETNSLKSELRRAEEEIVRKEEEKRSIEIDYNKLCERYKELQQDNEHMFVKFEDKLASFKEMMRNDNESYLEKRSVATAEIDKLRAHTKDLIREVKEKNSQIEELNLRVKYYKEDINKYKGLFDQRLSTAGRSFGEIDKLSPSFGATDPDGFDLAFRKSATTKNSYKTTLEKNSIDPLVFTQDERRTLLNSITFK